MQVNKQILLAAVSEPFTYARLKEIAFYLATTFTRLVGLAIAVGVVFYGLRMILARGDPTAYGAAKKGLVNAMIAALVVFGVYTIIATLYGAVDSLRH
jgi:hypothetical protein